MSRYTGPKARLCRRFGMNIFGADKYDKILAKRNFPPGMHGQSHTGKKSEYGKQLLEKQKARYMFGINERQFVRYYERADRSASVTGEQLLRFLELRLDNVMFRAGIGATRPHARQMISHGLFTLNGRRVTIPSIQVKVGDKIQIRTKSLNSPMFNELKHGKSKIKPPSWLNADTKTLTVEVLAMPEAHELEQAISSHMIVEFYSK